MNGKLHAFIKYGHFLDYYAAGCHYNMVENKLILHTALTRSENISKVELTKNNPYLTLAGELWCAFHEDFSENLTHYHGTALYL